MRRLWTVIVSSALVFSAGAVGVASAQTPAKRPAPASALLAKGQKALAAGDYAGALRQGGAFVAAYPKRYEGHRLVGQATFGLDRPDRAEAAYRQALKLAPAAARPALQAALKETASLRQALAEAGRAERLKAAGDVVGAARAQERAYRTLPSRVAFGLAAAELFESAGRIDDAERALQELRKKTVAKSFAQRLSVLETRIEADRKRTAAETAQREEADRNAAAERRAEDKRLAEQEARRAQEAERKRVEAEREAERRAEEERQRAEKARLDREETDRLNAVLADYKRAASDAESAVRTGESAIDDAQRTVRRIEGDLDDARESRNRAKRERDKWQDKVDEAKTDIERNVFRNELRSAESAYDDAKGKFDRINGRLDDAKSRLSGARQEVDAARQRLDQARRNVRDTEDALTRVGSGA